MRIVLHVPGEPDSIRDAPPRIMMLMTNLHGRTRLGQRLLANRAGDKPTPITYEALQKLVKELGSDDELHIHVVPKEESARALRDTGVNVKVAVYVPSFRSDTLNDLLMDLRTMVTSAVREGAQFFLAPEYFFTKSSGEAFSSTDKQTLDTQMLALSAQHPDVLIIAGTIFWFDQRTRRLFNTALVLYQGSVTGYYKVHMDVRDAVLDKNDRLLSNSGRADYELGPGLVPQLDLAVRGLSCRIQICADVRHTNQKDFDLQFVASSAMGVLNSHAHEGGWTFIADREHGIRVHAGGVDQGDGKGAPVDKYPGGSCRIFEKIVKPLAQPPALAVQDLRPPSLRTT